MILLKIYCRIEKPLFSFCFFWTFVFFFRILSRDSLVMGAGGYEGDEKGGDFSGRGGGGGGSGSGGGALKPPAGFKVFVGGIPFKWDDQDLRDFFMKLGNVVHAKVSCSCRRSASLHARFAIISDF
jgi:hypothetical protein